MSGEMWLCLWRLFFCFVFFSREKKMKECNNKPQCSAFLIYFEELRTLFRQFYLFMSLFSYTNTTWNEVLKKKALIIGHSLFDSLAGGEFMDFQCKALIFSIFLAALDFFAYFLYQVRKYELVRLEDIKRINKVT